MNYWNKDKKKTNTKNDKKRSNWNQTLTKNTKNKSKKIKKSLQYLLILKKIVFTLFCYLC
jgi:hypothetical protein